MHAFKKFDLLFGKCVCGSKGERQRERRNDEDREKRVCSVLIKSVDQHAGKVSQQNTSP